MITIATGDQLATKAGILVNFQHVDAGVGHRRLRESLQRCAPARRSLVWKPGNQVDVHIVNAGSSQLRDVRDRLFRGMKSADRIDFRVYKGLRAEAHPISSAL